MLRCAHAGSQPVWSVRGVCRPLPERNGRQPVNANRGRRGTEQDRGTRCGDMDARLAIARVGGVGGFGFPQQARQDSMTCMASINTRARGCSDMGGRTW